MASSPPSVTIVPNFATFSRGDDLDHLLRHGASPVDALRAYEALLRGDADRIRAIVAAITPLPADQVAVAAEHHYIGVTLPARDAERLIADGVARAEVSREEEHVREERRRW